jgi:DNA-directed RNA polymerase specialized sigma24 family protein
VHHDNTIVLRGFARSIIRRKARFLVRCDGFTARDLPDVEQELRLRLLQSLPQYDPAQGHINVFITTVVERSVAMLVRERWAKKRNSTGIESLDAGPAGNDTTTDVPDRPGAGGPERFDLALDLDGVLTALPAELRDLALRLREQTVSQAARAMNVPRTTLLRQVERLRQCCEDAGLRIYL